MVGGVFNNNDHDDYFVLLNFSILRTVTKLLSCPDCHTDGLCITDNLHKRMRFSHILELSCSSCDWHYPFSTSKELVNVAGSAATEEKNGRHKYEANVRAVIAFREIGRGFQSIQTFSQCMNLYSVGHTAFVNLNNNDIYKAYAEAAKASMHNVASQIRKDDSLLLLLFLYLNSVKI